MYGMWNTNYDDSPEKLYNGVLIIFGTGLLLQVIEMSGVCAASDIWSVGCTVIEFLTCVPPYYDLQPMPALFRIVQVLSRIYLCSHCYLLGTTLGEQHNL